MRVYVCVCVYIYIYILYIYIYIHNVCMYFTQCQFTRLNLVHILMSVVQLCCRCFMSAGGRQNHDSDGFVALLVFQVMRSATMTTAFSTRDRDNETNSGSCAQWFKGGCLL